MRDRRLLYAAAFLRSAATAMIGVLLGVYLARLEFGSAQIGAIVSAGLAGAAVATLVVMLWGDRIGRRPVLLVVTALGAAGALGAAASSSPWIVGIASFLGMLNGMGRDRGAGLVVDQAILPETVDARGRTKAFAWYGVCQDAGSALGGLLAGLPALIRGVTGAGDMESVRIGFAAHAGLLLLAAVPYLALSPAAARSPAHGRNVRIAPESRRVLTKVCALFGIDSVAGGFITSAFLTLFFMKRFGVDEGALAFLFAAKSVLNAVSHLGAAWLAARIGLVNTMVFTHIPSSLLLATVTVAPSFEVAALLFLLREGLVEMDVPTRQSYVMAVVRPEERTFASGATHLVRMAGWAVAPVLAGVATESASLALPLLVAAGMKITYDVLLWFSFRHVKPPEER